MAPLRRAYRSRVESSVAATWPSRDSRVAPSRQTLAAQLEYFTRRKRRANTVSRRDSPRTSSHARCASWLQAASAHSPTTSPSAARRSATSVKTANAFSCSISTDTRTRRILHLSVHTNHSCKEVDNYKKFDTNNRIRERLGDGKSAAAAFSAVCTRRWLPKLACHLQAVRECGRFCRTYCSCRTL